MCKHALADAACTAERKLLYSFWFPHVIYPLSLCAPGIYVMGYDYIIIMV